MNKDKLLSALQWAGAGLGVIGGVMSIRNLQDERKNGYKFREDQLDYIADRVAERAAPQIGKSVIGYLSSNIPGQN